MLIRLLLAVGAFLVLRRLLTWIFNGFGALGGPRQTTSKRGTTGGASGPVQEQQKADELSDQGIEEAEYEELP